MDQALSRSEVERGPWPTSIATIVALLPLIVGVALGIAADRKLDFGPLSPNMLIYWVVVPLAALYPTVAAVARRLGCAPMTVLVIASIAPALVYASRILLQPLPKGPTGQILMTPSTILW